MRLSLIAPGTRKNNRCWYVRGFYAGRRIELTAGTTDKREAERFLRAVETRLREHGETAGDAAQVTLPRPPRRAHLKLLPPGSRSKRFWYVRGTVPDGRRIEVSTRTTDKRAAEQFRKALARG
jgi:hypothetical protein